jgi:hypothetical protein
MGKYGRTIFACVTMTTEKAHCRLNYNDKKKRTEGVPNNLFLEHVVESQAEPGASRGLSLLCSKGLYYISLFLH